MRADRRRLLCHLQRAAQVLERLTTESLSHSREYPSFFLFDVPPNVLDEESHLGVEALRVRVQAIKLCKGPLDDVMLLEPLEDLILEFWDGFPHRWVEHLLLDGCVNG